MKIVEFISFCIEMYARQRKISGGVVADCLRRSGGYDYLRDGYEVLHTMGREWLVEDLEEYFKTRGVVVDQDNLRVLLPSKIALTLDEVARVKGTDPTQEIAEFYGSEVYRRLESEATKYWCFSPAELCDIYLQSAHS